MESEAVEGCLYGREVTGSAVLADVLGQGLEQVGVDLPNSHGGEVLHPPRHGFRHAPDHEVLTEDASRLLLYWPARWFQCLRGLQQRLGKAGSPPGQQELVEQGQDRAANRCYLLWRMSIRPLLLFALVAGCAAPPTRSTEPRVLGIIGGEPTEAWPAVGAYLLDDGAAGLCTGTLVGNRTVLTAAHCIAWGDHEVGDTFFFGHDVYGEGETIAVSEAIVHPDYDPEESVADLALAILEYEPDTEPFALNAEPVDSTWEGEMLRAVGFGATDGFDGITPGLKMETDVEIDEVWGDVIYHQTPEHHTCSGDSGGPLFSYRSNGWVLAAVASFVYPLEKGDDPCSGGGGDIAVDTSLDWMGDYLEVPVWEEEEWTPPTAEERDGCECRAAGGAGSSSWATLLLLAFALFGRRWTAFSP